MKVNVSGCRNCGAPLPVMEGQFVTQCTYCGNKSYVHRDLPPAIVLKPRVDKQKARDIVLKELRHDEVSPSFLSRSFFEGAVLYYIPFFELRGIRAGFTSSSPSKPPEYSYSAYNFIEKANDLSDLSLEPFDSTTVENAVISAEQIPFNPVEMRKKGVVIPPRDLVSLLKNQDPHARESVESHRRLVYFPVWEIGYTFRGIIFKSYVSAVDGRPLKTQALRSHKKKLRISLFGMLSMAILLGRGINSGGGGLVMAAIFVLPLSTILFPYLWELFAFQEMVEKQGDTIDLKTINYTENSFEKFSRKMMDGVLNLFGGGRNHHD